MDICRKLSIIINMFALDYGSRKVWRLPHATFNGIKKLCKISFSCGFKFDLLLKALKNEGRNKLISK